jgi:hypothetical protein
MPITFSCTGCGQGYKVPDTSAGRSTKCRKCGTVVKIPKISSIASKPSVPAPAPPADDFSSFSVDAPPDTRLKKKKKKGKKGLMLALVGLMFAFFGCCLLPGVGGGAYYYFYLLGSDDGMKYLPENPSVIASIRIQDLINSEVATQVKKEVPDSDKDLGEFKRDMAEAGLTSEDFDRVLIGYAAGTSDYSTVMILRKPIDLPKSLKSGKDKNKKFKEITVGKFIVYEEETTGPNLPAGLIDGPFKNVAYCSPEPKVVVMGPTKSLQAILTRGKKPELSETMKGAMKHADMKKTIAVATDVKAIKAKFPEQAAQMKMGFEKVDGSALTVNIQKDVVVEAVLVCQDDASAESLRKSIEGLLTLAKGFLDNPQVPSEAKTAIDAVKFTNSGNAVFANVVINGADLAKGIGKSVGKKSVPVFQPVGPGVPVGPVPPGPPMPRPPGKK